MFKPTYALATEVHSKLTIENSCKSRVMMQVIIHILTAYFLYLWQNRIQITRRFVENAFLFAMAYAIGECKESLL